MTTEGGGAQWEEERPPGSWEVLQAQNPQLRAGVCAAGGEAGGVGAGGRCREQDRPGCGCGRAAPAATPTPVPFLQHSATLVPAETFSSEFVEPRVRCISSHGAFSPSR